jgi:hypothetical protein
LWQVDERTGRAAPVRTLSAPTGCAFGGSIIAATGRFVFVLDVAADGEAVLYRFSSS